MAVVAAVASALAVSTLTAEIVVAVGSVAAGVGLNLLANELAPAANTPTTAGETGIKQETEIGGRVPRSILLGEDCVTAGQLVALDTNDGDDRYLNYVFLVSDYLTTELKHVFADDKEVELDSGNNSSNDNKGRAIKDFRKNGEEYGWLRFYDGRQTSADNWLVGKLPGWDNNNKLIGCSYICVTLRYNRKVFENYPKFRFVIDGAPLYDPRKDSTVPGGSGSHRFGNLSTHEFSANPAVINYNILRGFTVAGLPFYGFQGVALEDIPLAEFTAAADRCDELVDKKGGTERRYRAGGEVTVDTPVGDALEAFNATMDGEIVEDGGLFKLYAGGVSAPIMDITDADILDDSDEEARAGVDFAEHINGVTATFLDPDQDFLEAALPSRISDVQKALDGGQLLTIDLDLSKVHSQSQAQRIMEAVRRRALLTRTHRLTLHPRAYKVRVGQTIRLSSARLGYDVKLFQVRRASYDAACCPTFELREIDGTIWDWTPSTDEITKDGQKVDPQPTSPKSVAGFTVTSSRELGARGNELGLRLLWTPPDHRKIDALLYEWRRFGQTRKRKGAARDPEDGVEDIIGGVQSSTQYEARARYRLDNGDVGPWTDWQSVTTQGRIPNTSLVPNLTTVDAGISEQQNGRRTGAYLKLGWANPGEPAVRAVEFWYRERKRNGDWADWQEAISKNLDARMVRIEKGVRPSTDYQIQPRFIYQDGEEGPWGLTYTKTTPAAFNASDFPVPVLSVVPVLATGAGGTERPGFKVTVTDPGDARVERLLFQYRKNGDNNWSDATERTLKDYLFFRVFEGIQKRQGYDFRSFFLDENGNKSNVSNVITNLAAADAEADKPDLAFGDNRAFNFSFEELDNDGMPRGWTPGSSSGFTVGTTESNRLHRQTYLQRVGTGNGSFDQTPSKYVDAKEGQTWSGTVWMRRTGGATFSSIGVRIVFYDQDKNQLEFGGSTTSSLTTTWEEITVVRTAPVGTAFVSVRLFVVSQASGGSVLWDFVELQRQRRTREIETGAVDGTRLAINVALPVGATISGETVETVRTRSADPAGTINANGAQKVNPNSIRSRNNDDAAPSLEQFFEDDAAQGGARAFKGSMLSLNSVDSDKILKLLRNKVFVDSAGAGARTLANIMNAAGEVKGGELEALSILKGKVGENEITRADKKFSSAFVAAETSFNASSVVNGLSWQGGGSSMILYKTTVVVITGAFQSVGAGNTAIACQVRYRKGTGGGFTVVDGATELVIAPDGTGWVTFAANFSWDIPAADVGSAHEVEVQFRRGGNHSASAHNTYVSIMTFAK